MTIYVSDTISLELIDYHHAASIFGLVDSNRDHLGEWLPWVSKMQSVEDFEKFVAHSNKRHSEKAELAYVIVENGHVIGRVGLYHINNQDKIASVGYWIGKGHEGKGIITTACRKLISHGFSELGLNRIEIRCGTGNDKSLAVPMRLGFKKEGIIRQGELVNNRFIDLYLYSILKEEWTKS